MTGLSRQDSAELSRLKGLEREARKAVRKSRQDRTHAPVAAKRDRGRNRDNGHLAWIRRLPCVATYARTGEQVYGCQAAHLRMTDASKGKPHPGKGVKPSDFWTAPLTPEQHAIQGDVKGERRFWAELGIDPFDLCKALYAVTGDDDAGLKVIRDFAGWGEVALEQYAAYTADTVSSGFPVVGGGR